MEYEVFRNSIVSEFSQRLKLSLSDLQVRQFFDFMNLLIEKNKVMNLTAIDEPSEIITRHFVDSCMPVKIYGKEKYTGLRVIDVGTGAGFPGLPLAIVLPEAEFVLTDTLGKRVNFIDEVVKNCQIGNVNTIKARAEDLARDKMLREKFDICFSRGVAKLSVLTEYSLPFVKVNGKMLSFKLNDCDDELKQSEQALTILGGMFHVKQPYTLLSDEPQRCIVEIEKVKPTPRQYPRKAGTPSKSPLE